MSDKKIIKNGTGAPLPNPIANGKKTPLEDSAREKMLSRIRLSCLKGNIDSVTSEISSPGAIPLVGDLLSDEEKKVRLKTAEALGLLAHGGFDISFAIPALGTALADKDPDVRKNTGWALAETTLGKADIPPLLPALRNASADKDEDVRGHAARIFYNIAFNGHDISPEIPMLITALADEGDNVRFYATAALSEAARQGADISPAISALINELSEKPDNWVNVPASAAEALKNSAQSGSQEIKETILREMMSFLRSTTFMLEAEKNSIRFVSTMKNLESVLETIREKEAA